MSLTLWGCVVCGVAPQAGAKLEQTGFRPAPVEERWLAYAENDRASVEDGATWIATSRYGGWSAIALLHAIPR